MLYPFQTTQYRRSAHHQNNSARAASLHTFAFYILTFDLSFNSTPNLLIRQIKITVQKSFLFQCESVPKSQCKSVFNFVANFC